MQQSKGRLAKYGALAAVAAGGSIAPAAISPVQAQTAPLVDVCTGLSVDDSVLRGILNTTVVPTASSVEALYDVLLPKSILGVSLLGSLTDVNLGIASTTSSIASGDLIGVTLLDTDGQVIGAGDCNLTADNYSLNTGGGISIGGNQISGLGENGLAASAAELDAIAFGNSATTASGATGAVAIGSNASATLANGVALGAGSIENRGALTDYTAPGITGTVSSAGAVSIGSSGSERQLTNLAPGTADSDAATVGQLSGSIALATADSVNYDGADHLAITLDGSGGTTISNVADGTLSAASTDAVNGSQLFTTNQNVADNTTSIATNTSDIASLDTRVGTNETDIAALSDSAVQYDDGSLASVTLGGATGTTITNVAPGTVDAGSTDAINGGQLYATNENVTANATAITNLDTRVGTNETDIAALDTRLGTSESDILALDTRLTTNEGDILTNTSAIAALDAAAVQYDDGTLASVTLGGADGTVITNVADGSLSAASSDAVNGSQLFTTNQDVATNTASISANTSAIATNSSDIASLDTRVDINETDIAALSTSAVQYDDGTFGLVTLDGGVDGTRITNVAEGTLDASSTDAVNGSQLYATNQNVTANADDIASLDSRVTTNEGDIAALDTRIGTSETDIATLTASAVQYDDGSFASVTLGGADGTVITNVAEGTLSAASSDAVNGSQLFTTNQNVATNTAGIAGNTSAIAGNTSEIAGLDTRVGDNETDIAALASAAVQYDDGTNATVTLNGSSGTRLTNLADGTVSAGSSDAVTGSQLFAVNQTIATLDYAAVQYDDIALATVTFEGSGGTTLRNVAPGTLSGTSTDAVNGTQLFTTNQAVSQNTSDVTTVAARVTVNEGDIASLDGRVTVNEGGVAANTSAITSNQTAISGNTTAIASLSASAVQYDGPANTSVTLSGSGGTTLTNVADATLDATSSDAVTGAQLFATNQQVDQNTAAIAALGSGSGAGFAVSYTDGTLTEVALGGASGTTVSNLADGELSASSTEAVNGSQLFATNQAVINLDGRITSNTNAIGGLQTTVSDHETRITQNEGDIANLDGRVTINESNIASNTGAIGLLQTAVGTQQTTIANFDGRITQNEGDIAGLDARVTVNEGDIAGLDGRVTVNEGDIASLGGRVTVNEGNIASLDGRVTTNTTRIAGVQAQVDNVPVGFVRDDDPAVRSAVPTNTAAYRGAGGNSVRVTNVSEGTLAEGSTDAVNGGQLHATNEAVASNRRDIDQNTSDIQTLNNNVAGSTVVAVQYSHAVTPTQSNGGTITNHAAFVGADSDMPVAVHNVAAGVLPNDAVNVGQMQAGLNAAYSQSLGYTDMRVAQVRFDLAETRAAAFAGTASALAVAGIPQTMDADRSMIGGGIGHFRGESAFAIGASSVLGDGKAIIKVGASINTTGHGSFSGGAGIAF